MGIFKVKNNNKNEHDIDLKNTNEIKMKLDFFEENSEIISVKPDQPKRTRSRRKVMKID